MPDDRIQQGLDAYADHLQRSAHPAPAAAVRRRAARRRRNRAAGAAFAGVLILAAGLGTIRGRSPDVAPVAPSASPAPTSTVRSDVTQLRRLGIDLQADVLIDVADDGVDRWLRIGAGDTVAFTGAAKDDTTKMSLRPAPVTDENRVVIAPPARPGFCVAATAQPPLVLRPCRDGDPAQTWQIRPAGDSGQFELDGEYGIVTVDGRTGLQTIRFDR